MKTKLVVKRFMEKMVLDNFANLADAMAFKELLKCHITDNTEILFDIERESETDSCEVEE